MTQEAHQHHSTENKPKTALTSSFWFVLILAGLFIAAVNFINVMSHSEGEGQETHEAVHNGAAEETTAPAEGHEGAATPEATQPAGAAGHNDSATNAEGSH